MSSLVLFPDDLILYMQPQKGQVPPKGSFLCILGSLEPQGLGKGFWLMKAESGEGQLHQFG